ncbi:MAG: hypothetical protein M3Z01_02075, partial [Thermoproteota archaeon]|nr:hypothetical protein [Thermoproteota archaeon]
ITYSQIYNNRNNSFDLSIKPSIIIKEKLKKVSLDSFTNNILYNGLSKVLYVWKPSHMGIFLPYV